MANLPARFFPLMAVSVDVGAATRNFYVKAPVALRLIRMDGSNDASDGTDYITATLVTGSTTIYSLTMNASAADTVISDTDPATGVDVAWPADTTFKLTLTYSGTAANVKGTNVVVWAEAVR